MRCKYCGWDNQPNSPICEKCGQPMAGAATQSYVTNFAPQAESHSHPTVIFHGDVPQPAPAQPRPTVVFNGGSPQDPLPKKTVVFRPDEAPTPQYFSAPTQQFQEGAPTMRTCPACGYPVTGSSSTCPQCGSPISAQQATPQRPSSQPHFSRSEQQVKYTEVAETTTCHQCGTEISTESKFCPHCGAPVRLSTIRFSRRKKFEPTYKCSLSLVPEEDEGIEPLTQEYTGKQIILTRENTEPGNRTITSHEQAVLICENDKWFVENRSEQGTTFIKVNRKIELCPGDILILGDREFRFDYQLPPED